MDCKYLLEKKKQVFSLCETVPVSHALLLTFFFLTASTLLYAQETTTAQLRSYSCFPDRLVILNEDRIFQTIRRRDSEENPKLF